MSDARDLATVEVAGRLAGVSARTIRYWITSGKLPATAGPRGRLVVLADVRRLAEVTGKGSGNQESPVATAAEVPAGTAVPPAESMMALVRDEWLSPLVDRIGSLERQVGRLEAERDAALAELASLRERQLPEAPAERVSWWRRWLGL